MSRILAAALVVILSAAPVLTQPSGTGTVGGPARATTATGVTKPPGKAGAPFSRASTEADMLKAQRAATARDKAWDSKMRTTMGSICKGC